MTIQMDVINGSNGIVDPYVGIYYVVQVPRVGEDFTAPETDGGKTYRVNHVEWSFTGSDNMVAMLYVQEVEP
jgi:hypothetical protein